MGFAGLRGGLESRLLIAELPKIAGTLRQITLFPRNVNAAHEAFPTTEQKCYFFCRSSP